MVGVCRGRMRAVGSKGFILRNEHWMCYTSALNWNDGVIDTSVAGMKPALDNSALLHSFNLIGEAIQSSTDT